MSNSSNPFPTPKTSGSPQKSAPPNPTLVELRSLRHELAETKEEVVKLRAELDYKKLPNVSDQVAIGMLKAGAVLWLLGLLISGIAPLFGGGG